MYCKKCGNIIDESAKFCPKCGGAVGIENVNETKGDKSKKPLFLIFLIIIIAIVMGGIYLKRTEFDSEVLEESVDKKSEDDNSVQSYTIDGTYIGESPRQWVLQIYSYEGLVTLDEKIGTYEKVSDDEWLIMIDDYAMDLTASMTAEGNLYITSDNSNWDSELYYRKDITGEKIDLKEYLGKSEAVVRETLEEFKIVDERETWSELGDGNNYLDSGTAIWIEDGIVSKIALRQKSIYSFDNIYVGQKYNKAEKILKREYKLSSKDERYEKGYYYYWEKEEDERIYIEEVDGKIILIGVERLE